MFSQNLVSNNSYEQYSQCPSNENQVSYSVGWKSYFGTPDYYNACAIDPWVAIPNNIGGSYQQTATGSAYCGFYAYWSPTYSGPYKNIREHIGRQLSSPLVVGTKYFVSFKVSLAYNAGSASCATNNIGAKFSSVPYDLYATDSISSPLVNNIAHVYTTALITDTANWTTISRAFIADSAYNYIIIGNFFKDANTDTLILYSSNWICYSYYYLDDICVSTDSLTCNNITGIMDMELDKIINIYPIPFSNSTTLVFKDGFHFNNCNVTLYDIFGGELRNYEMKSTELKIERDGLPEGIYFLRIQVDNAFFTKKILIIN